MLSRSWAIGRKKSRHLILGIAVGVIICLPILLTSRKISASPLAPRSEEEQTVISAYKKVNAAVVNIRTKMQGYDFFANSYQQGSGSGVVIDASKGYLVTNYHVIQGANQISVTLADGQTYAVKVIGLDPASDLTLLQILNPPADLVEAPLGDSASLEVGQRVLAIGNPFGLERTLTSGIISSLGRTIRAQNESLIEDIIQIDAAINPGNSGGPLLDTAGSVVGINTAIISGTGENAGIGFAIPVDQIKRALPQLIKHGKVLRPKIGVIIRDTNYGPIIDYVDPGSPAEKVGLSGLTRAIKISGSLAYIQDFSSADIIVAVNGNPVNSKAGVVDAIEKTKQGQAVSLTVRRGVGYKSKILEIKIEPEMG